MPTDEVHRGGPLIPGEGLTDDTDATDDTDTTVPLIPREGRRQTKPVADTPPA